METDPLWLYQPQCLEGRVSSAAQRPLGGAVTVSGDPIPDPKSLQKPQVQGGAVAIRQGLRQFKAKGLGLRGGPGRSAGCGGGTGRALACWGGDPLAFLTAAPQPHGRPVRLRGAWLQVLGKEVSRDRGRAQDSPRDDPGEGAMRRRWGSGHAQNRVSRRRNCPEPGPHGGAGTRGTTLLARE